MTQNQNQAMGVKGKEKHYQTPWLVSVDVVVAMTPLGAILTVFTSRQRWFSCSLTPNLRKPIALLSAPFKPYCCLPAELDCN